MPKIFSLKNIFWVRPYNLSYTHQDPHRNFEGSFDFHLYPAIKRYLVLLYSWVLCCLDLQGLWFRSGLGPKIFLNSIQVDWHLLFWLYSSILLIWYFLGGGGGVWLENLILKKTLSSTWTWTRVCQFSKKICQNPNWRKNNGWTN